MILVSATQSNVSNRQNRYSLPPVGQGRNVRSGAFCKSCNFVAWYPSLGSLVIAMNTHLAAHPGHCFTEVKKCLGSWIVTYRWPGSY